MNANSFIAATTMQMPIIHTIKTVATMKVKNTRAKNIKVNIKMSTTMITSTTTKVELPGSFHQEVGHQNLVVIPRRILKPSAISQ